MSSNPAGRANNIKGFEIFSKSLFFSVLPWCYFFIASFRSRHNLFHTSYFSPITNFNRSPINRNEVILFLLNHVAAWYNDFVVDDDREVHHQPTSQKSGFICDGAEIPPSKSRSNKANRCANTCYYQLLLIRIENEYFSNIEPTHCESFQDKIA